MGAFSDGLATTALNLLTSYGEAVTFTNVAQGAYNPATGTTGASTDTVYTGFGFPTQFSSVEQQQEEILIKDVKLIVNKVSQRPAVDDIVEFSSKTYRVMDVQEVKAQGNDVIYILQVRI